MKKLLKIFVLLVVCGVAAFVVLRDTPKQKEAKYLKRGEALYDEGEYDKALLEYKNAMRVMPTDPEVNYRIGLLDEAQGDFRGAFANYYHAEQQNTHFHAASLKVAQFYLAAEIYDEAQKRFDAVLAEDPDNADAHAIHAALLLRLKDFARSEKEARLALEKDPANITAYSVLVGLYIAEKDIPQAGKTVDEAIAKNPKDLSLLMLKSHLYENPLNVDKIKETYQQIFALKPKEAAFRAHLADIYLGAGKTDDAEATLRAGVAELPDNWDMKRQLVAFLDKNRGIDVAEREIRGYMAATPDNSDLYFWLADLYMSHNATDKAIALLQQVVAKDSDAKEGLNAQTSLARIHFAKGDKALATKMVDAVLQKAPRNRDALFIRASLESDQGHYQAAVDDLRTIISDQPRTKEALQLLGEILLVQGHKDLAIDTMNHLLEIDPLNNAARVRLAQMYAANGDSKRALELVKLVTENAPKYSVGWETTARINIDTKDYDAAEDAIKKLDGLDGQHMTAVFLEGQLDARRGKTAEAKALYMQVITANPSAPLAQHALDSLVAFNKDAAELEATANGIAALKSDDPYVNTVLGQCYIKLGKLDKATAALDKAIASGTPRQDPYLDRARIYLNDDKKDLALDMLKKAAARVPSDIRAPMMEAEVLRILGEYTQAIELYGQLLKNDPTLDLAANNMAAVISDHDYQDPDMLEKARQTAERFAGSTNPLLLDTLAWVYYRQGNYDQALAVMSRTAAAKTIPPEIHYHYGAILAKENKKVEAREQLQLATGKDAKYPDLEEAKKLLATL